MLNRDILLDFPCPVEEGQLSSGMCGLVLAPGAVIAWEVPERGAVMLVLRTERKAHAIFFPDGFSAAVQQSARTAKQRPRSGGDPK